MSSKRSDIFDALKTQLSSKLTWAKVIEWEKVRILTTDFPEHELPCIQFYHVRTDYQPQQGRVEARMEVNVEVCIKSTATEVVDQQTLFDYMDGILQAIGQSPNLGVAGVIHMRLLRDETDAHTLLPHFIGILTFEVLYLTTFTGC
jgi:hypothetical protein